MSKGKFLLPVIALLTILAVVGGSCISAMADSGVVRNTVFTSMSDMKKKLGNNSNVDWSEIYLTEPENAYWTFANQSNPDSNQLTIDIAKNTYRSLEMLLDDGYLLDYNTLAAYCAEYLEKKEGSPDAFYNILSDCLNNPYLLNKPAATVTATSYNGRDYSKVFDASYYAAKYPDIAASVGNDPAELLRDFVEKGINSGRTGNASFDVNAYAATVDAEVLETKKSSAAYKALGDNASEPLGKYSYSLANYYGKYLGHYNVLAADDSSSSSSSTVKDTGSSAAKTVTGTYTENSTISVYTGEPVSSTLANQRPIAIMIPTDSAAQPSYGIGLADILYEIMEEGGISRQMAIIPDWKGYSRLGNVRSCRLYYIAAAREWDPILIHFGGVAYMKGTIDAADINNISGTYEYGTGGKAPGAGYFFRTSDRKAPHNAYISSEGIEKACAKLGYQTSLRQGYYNSKHFTFANSTNDLSQYSSAQNASKIDLSNVFSYTKTTLDYDSSTGLYKKNLHGKAQTDAITGKQLTFANVIVQNTSWEQLDKKGYLGFNMIDTSQDGWFCTKGKAIHLTWKKTSDYSPTVYYDDSGNEIQLNKGKTYIAIAQAGKNVKFN
mgnify:CR=1 FL=1